MTKPVFCDRCRYQKFGDWQDDTCKAVYEDKLNWNRPYKEYAVCCVRNKDNDCTLFRPGLIMSAIYTIAWWLTR